jgi:hypothetical protein
MEVQLQTSLTLAVYGGRHGHLDTFMPLPPEEENLLDGKLGRAQSPLGHGHE